MHNIYYLGLSGEHRCPLGYLLSVAAAVVQWTKRRTRKTEEVSSNLSTISFYYFFPIKSLFALKTQEICEFYLLIARTVYNNIYTWSHSSC